VLTPIIELDQVHFSWDQAQPVLDIPQLKIYPGERIFLHGPSGSGKSSLLNLIGGINTPNQGNVSVLGQKINQQGSAWRDRFRSNHIGLIFQQFNLLPYLSVIENVLLPCRFSAKRRQRAISRYGSLNSAATKLLEQLGIAQSMLNRPVTALSIGQQQRVAAARALIGSPELLIADEPTSALDSDSRNAFLQLLINECDHNETTLIFVSHDNSLQANFSRVISLAQLNQVEVM